MTELPGPSSCSTVLPPPQTFASHPSVIDGFLRDSLLILSITMPQIPTPPASRPGSEAPEVEIKPAEVPGASTELLQSLDILLEQYLHLLDRQQELQSGLAKQLSSVYDSVV